MNVRMPNVETERDDGIIELKMSHLISDNVSVLAQHEVQNGDTMLGVVEVDANDTTRREIENPGSMLFTKAAIIATYAEEYGGLP